MTDRNLVAARGLLIVQRRRAVRHGQEHLLPALDALLALVEIALALDAPPAPTHAPGLVVRHERRRFAPTAPLSLPQYEQTALGRPGAGFAPTLAATQLLPLP